MQRVLSPPHYVQGARGVRPEPRVRRARDGHRRKDGRHRNARHVHDQPRLAALLRRRLARGAGISGARGGVGARHAAFLLLLHAVCTSGCSLHGGGAWDDASRCFSDAAARAQGASNPEMLGYARTRQAELDVLRGRPREAIALLQPRLDASDLTWIYDVVLLRVLAEAYVDAGDAV